MQRTLILFATILLISTSIGFAQTAVDEQKVIEAALKTHLSETLPYVEHWVVSEVTEPLDLGSLPDTAIYGARPDYLARNKEPLNMRSFTVPANAVVSDVSRFTSGRVFNWEAFENDHVPGAWTARVSRPGFADASTAAVRIDAWARHKLGPLTTVAIVKKLENGAWTYSNSFSPAVK